uniref:Novel plant SNARE 11 n=1 Tax=Tanacetum cinerariifolium TaxID=118510 RepID=A0A6L2MK74_TANCI|nr:novel plant SNARE 11 [Tanacetum cinerariifolium]
MHHFLMYKQVNRKFQGLSWGRGRIYLHSTFPAPVPGGIGYENQQLMDNGHQMMDETDQAIERSKRVFHETVNVETKTAAALKAQVCNRTSLE